MRIHQKKTSTFFYQLFFGWFFCCIMPFLLLFYRYILNFDLLATQIVSFFLMSAWLLGSLVYVNRFSTMIGRLLVLPSLLLSLSSILVLLLVFRLPYSVYYLATSVFLGVMYHFLLFYWIKEKNKPAFAYVAQGRCVDLPFITQVNWQKLDTKTLGESHNAVVADFSDNLTKDWQTRLAKISLSGVPVYHVLQVQEALTGRTKIEHLHENNLGSLLPSPIYVLIKYLLDVAVIVVTSPIVLPLCILTALGIWLDDKRHQTSAPIIFSQKRIGQGEKVFTMYKFRSMIPTSEAQGAKMAVAGDARITKFGRFIRKTRLDELPQFINVLKGEMSLIGPRPEQPSFVAQFNESIPFYTYRHIVKPGISGWAQVMHGYASDEDETKVKLEHDFYYIKNFSFTLDLLIVIKTIQTMLTGFGAR